MTKRKADLAMAFLGCFFVAMFCMATPPVPSAMIVEGYGWKSPGFGWKNLWIGMSREELAKVMGKADQNSTADWFKWINKHVECTFHNGATGLSEIRFDPGFEGALKNGIKVGSPAAAVEMFYGQPEFVKTRPSGAKHLEYSTKGVLFWTYRGKITQIVVFKPYQHH